MTKLFWKIAIVFLLVLLMVSGITMYITYNNAQRYTMEVTQNLGKDIARNTVDQIIPLMKSEDMSAAMQDIMHSMMVINPGVEVYHLDTTGKILNYVAPDKVVKLQKVSLEPIRQFTHDNTTGLIEGDDPRHPGKKNIFSAAPIKIEGSLIGYIYIILASDLFSSQESLLQGSYINSTILRSIIVTFVVAFVLGLIAIFIITRRLNKMIFSFRQFKDGDLNTRMEVSQGELGEVSETFNEMASTIQRNLEELKGVDKLRKELISNVSHDLRTPISSIQGFAELLQTKGQQLSVEEKTEYLDVVLKNVDRLKNLVNDLFELSKLESQAIKTNMEPLSIGELITDIASKFRFAAQEKGVSINTFYSQDLPLAIADIGLIDRALQNLLDNALKFCNKGDVISIELNRDSLNNIEVHVCDTGEGISEADLPQIFDRYYRGKSESSRSGTGLGLAITKKIIELHGSSIVVKSQIQQGTRFTFSLPSYSTV
jgi:signal transduction histidine kinase